MDKITLYSKRISSEVALVRGEQKKIEATLTLLEGGSTVPFIARYRKEQTGGLDEVAIASVRNQYNKLQEFDKRRLAIIESLVKSEKITDDLKSRLQKAVSLTELEDIYLPYKQKRKTRGERALEQGLADLANILKRNKESSIDLTRFINPEQNVETAKVALAGARDILAETIAEDMTTRAKLRVLYNSKATISSRVVEKNREQGEKYSDYFQWQEIAQRAPSHRVLAMLRADAEKIVKITIRPEQEECLQLLHSLHFSHGPWEGEITAAIQDSYQRLLAPSLENELRKVLKIKADAEAIKVFASNLRQLLLTAPLGQQRVLAIDPGFRTGCKVVCLDAQGKLLATDLIFPTAGESNKNKAREIIYQLVQRFKIEAIGIGNGTAGRETEQFIRSLPLADSLIVTLVNEDGASIYSASEIARAEFPDHDITVRGAVSIGRRLQDPLAELVKIDPKSIGVGQYQHDVNQTELKNSLTDVVESCVNSVGVELNNASAELLTYVAGLGETLARNIVSYRDGNGPFTSRKELLKVPRLGPKAFEQCSGFLRISNGNNPLDATGVHPERYHLVDKIADDCGASVLQLLASEDLRRKIVLKNYIDEDTGMETLEDIQNELAKPGRDPRKDFEQFQFKAGVETIADLHEGMKLPGIITNITKFGAFANIGVKGDGLIHISEMADRFVKDSGEIVQIGQQVQVRILKIDTTRNRISLSLRKE